MLKFWLKKCALYVGIYGTHAKDFHRKGLMTSQIIVCLWEGGEAVLSLGTASIFPATPHFLRMAQIFGHSTGGDEPEKLWWENFQNLAKIGTKKLVGQEKQ